MAWLVFLGCLFGFISSGAMLGVAMGATGLIMLHFLGNGADNMLGMATWNYLNSYSLTALPLFLFMGEVLVHSGLSQRLYKALGPVFERLPGKLLHTNVAISTLFGAMSGSSMATAAAVGSVVYPELDKRGYNRITVAGSIAGSGTLGLLIPPSMALIAYGAWQDVSVGKLFMAGVIPGLMMALIFMTFIAAKSLINPSIVPKTTEAPIPLGRAIAGTVKIWPIGILIFTIMGTIYLGVATPTESAGMGAMAALILGVTLGNLNLKKVWNALFDTARISGFIGLVLVGASILAQGVALIGLPRALVMAVGQAELSPYLVITIVYAMYIVLGCFFDGISMLLMTLPFTFPIVVSLGFDPVWFGVIVVMVIEIGQITPPVGANLYVIEGITYGQVKVDEVAQGCIPYWIMLVLGMVILTIFPEICLWLPNHAF